ncbi:MAG: ABC transporter ATP-binding protein [Verrucomicrobiales bacterium]|nr:ABC transporter ATP-binding protein [Verrucomicrobiales bacterium]
MSNLGNIIRFGWPYLRRYSSRLIAGILVGILFGISNAVILGSADFVMQRLSGPKDKNPWQTYTLPAPDGANSTPSTVVSNLVISLSEVGEIWIDDLRWTDSAANPPGNPRAISEITFNETTNLTRATGSHQASVIEDPDQLGNKVLRILCTGSSSAPSSTVELALPAGHLLAAGHRYDVSLRAKPGRGAPKLILRYPGSGDERSITLSTKESSLPKLKSLSEWTDRANRWRTKVYLELDPWIPLKGRPMDGHQMLGVLLLFPALMALRGYLGFLSSYCLGWVSQRVVNDLQVDVLAKLQSLSVDFFNRSKLGDLTMRIHVDTAALQRSLDEGLGDIIKQPVTVVAIFGFLLVKDWALTLFLLVLLPFCLAPVIILGKKARKAATKGVQTKVSQANLLIEALAGIRVVKAFSLESQQLARFRNYATELVRHGVKGLQAKEMINPIIETVTALILGLLVVLLFKSGRNWDDMMLFILGLVSVYTPLKSLTRVHMIFQQSRVGIERMAQILDEQPTVREPANPQILPPFERQIRFEAVSFAYKDATVLHELSIEIPRGQKLGLAGESGSGKSTLLNLLFRFYDPTGGRVTIDGIDLRTLRTASLRDQMALVSQEIVLFDQTVAENIAYGKQGATPDEIEAAAKAAFAHEFILQLPHGYETQVGERGVSLSGGQRQRLAIARAFVRNAPILVLDEATASLDSQAESEVQRAIDVLAEHRTVICVAHRLSTLANLDRIIVLEKGRIVQDGTFQELIRTEGPFAWMARKQGMSGL